VDLFFSLFPNDISFVRNMQKEESVLFSLKQNVMQTDYHLPWEKVFNARLCMETYHKLRGKRLLLASEMAILVFWWQLMLPHVGLIYLMLIL